jgi:hypothetical protein
MTTIITRASVTTPAAFATLNAPAGLPTGVPIELFASLYFGGAVAPVDGTDSDNWRLVVDGTVVGTLGIPATLNAAPLTYKFAIVTTTGVVTLQAGANPATAGVIYRTTIVANIGPVL